MTPATSLAAVAFKMWLTSGRRRRSFSRTLASNLPPYMETVLNLHHAIISDNLSGVPERIREIMAEQSLVVLQPSQICWDQ